MMEKFDKVWNSTLYKCFQNEIYIGPVYGTLGDGQIDKQTDT